MEVDPTPEEEGVEADSEGGLGGGMLGELAGSIPGIDEAIVRRIHTVSQAAEEDHMAEMEPPAHSACVQRLLTPARLPVPCRALERS